MSRYVTKNHAKSEAKIYDNPEVLRRIAATEGGHPGRRGKDEGPTDCQQIADELGVDVQRVYTARKLIDDAGGIDNYLEKGLTSFERRRNANLRTDGFIPLQGPIEADWTFVSNVVVGKEKMKTGLTSAMQNQVVRYPDLEACMIPVRPLNLPAGTVWAHHVDHEAPSWVDPEIALELAATRAEVKPVDRLWAQRRMEELVSEGQLWEVVD